MSFPRYHTYKNSGVEWLGEVPAHWEVMRLGFLCEKIGSGKTPSGGSQIYVEEGVLFLRSQNVYDEGLHLDEVVYITDNVDFEMLGTRVQAGDILLNITGASLGRTCLVPSDFTAANVNQHVCIIRLRDARLRAFGAMALKSFGIKGQIDAAQTGAARDGLNFDQIASLIIAVPPPDERFAVTNFLDRENTKIDELVKDQERLIDLLKEKRQAVISHAVTKGLDLNAPMKASGVEWLGDVPEHWDVEQLRYIARQGTSITYGIVQAGPDVEGGIPYIRTSDMTGDYLPAEGYLRTSPEIVRLMLDQRSTRATSSLQSEQR
jgi:type I restriction enzyme S subunit